MLGHVFVDAFTKSAKSDAISHLKSAIAQADGVITDFAFYGGAVRLSVELEAGAITRLRDALGEHGVELFDRCAKTLERSASVSPVVAMLHVAFASEADLAPLASAH